MTHTLTDSTPTASLPRRRSVLSFVVQVASWSFVLAVVAVLAVAVVIPRIAGATPYTILTGSMTPALPPGTLVVVKPVPVDDIGIGTVVTYQLHSGEPTVVTHRVASVGVNGAGDRVFTTRGDANDAVDAAVVQPVQIRGELWYAVPYLGYANTWLTGAQRQAAVSVVAGALALYALWMFGSALADRRHGRQRREGQRRGGQE